MRFDTIIIGGGLSGLVCGIALAESGQRCAIVSTGQSALHFCSGSFDLLGRVNVFDVETPRSTLAKVIPQGHPYSVIGPDNVLKLAGQVPAMLKRAGIGVHGSAERNHYRITPLGILKPTWLSLDDFTVIPECKKLPWNRISIQNIAGFLDFHTAFVASNLERMGSECTVSAFTLPELDRLRKNPTEMRSVNIAKTLDNDDIIRRLIPEIVDNMAGAQAVALPAVFGLGDDAPVRLLKSELKRALGVTVCFIPVLPPSVPGIRVQTLLRRRFENLGGVYLLGDTVNCAEISGGRVTSVTTENLADDALEARDFVLATGSFFGRGLVARPDGIADPLFGLDTNAPGDRSLWYKHNLFDAQPYMRFGVKTDEALRGLINGTPVENLRVVGAGLGGFDPIKEASGAGVSIISALHAASLIAKSDSSHE